MGKKESPPAGTPIRHSKTTHPRTNMREIENQLKKGEPPDLNAIPETLNIVRRGPPLQQVISQHEYIQACITMEYTEK